MYAGHAALATFAKGKRPSIPLVVLVPVAFAPDWVEWIFAQFGRENRELSHSLVSVGIGATLFALLYFARTRAAVDSATVWLVYLSHWPADFITGQKPTWPGGPTVGLRLYDHVFADLLLESALIIVCWLVYLRSLPASSRRRPANYLVPLGLIALQVVFEAITRPDFG